MRRHGEGRKKDTGLTGVAKNGKRKTAVKGVGMIGENELDGTGTLTMKGMNGEDINKGRKTARDWIMSGLIIYETETK